jgi:hypothetical protein
MVCWNLHQTHLKEVDLTQIMAHRDNQTTIICHGYLDMLVQHSFSQGL